MQMLIDRVAARPGLFVADIMCLPAARIRPDATARQGAALLAYYGVTTVPVVERMGRVVGVLAAGDILHLRARETPGTTGPGTAAGECLPDAILDGYRVEEIMLPVLFSVSPDASVAEVAELMERTGTDRVIVADDGVLRGTVTTTDLLRALSTCVSC
jgi:CBS domain-containing protein